MKTLFSLFFLLAFFTPSAFALEKITDYKTQITVKPDGTLSIVETITVNAEHKQIKRGIYRDFPTVYTGSNGKRHKVSFNLLLVRRNGKPEPFKQVDKSNGVRVYIGNAHQYVPRGHQRYELHYTTDRQLQFFEDRIELYFNGIPHKFTFPMDQASVEVTLPHDAKILRSKAFTGPMGSRRENADIQMLADNIIRFTTRDPLGAKQGMTIALGIENGAIAPPTPSQLRAWFLADNQSAIMVSAAYSVFLGILALLWYRLGKDPKGGTIIPRFTPPKGLSPAICQYLTHRSASAKTFAVALLSLATKGYLHIAGSSKAFSVIKSDKDLSQNPPLSRAEQLIFKQLFEKSMRVRIGTHYDPVVARTAEQFKENIERHYGEENLVSNTLYIVFSAIAFIILSIFLTIAYLDGEAQTLAFIFGSAGAIGTVMFAGSGLMVYKNGAKFKAAIYVGFWFIFVAVEFWLMHKFGHGYSLSSPLFIHVACVIAAALGVNVFCFFIDTPTTTGRKLLDEIEGFKWYLSVAEGDDIKGLTMPTKTPQLYERYLPYALALGVQNTWSEQFSGVLEASQEASATTANSSLYRTINLHSIANNLDSGFSSALQTSSIDPASSGGGSGGSGFSGGSSGGGGGGGGGGGW